MIPHFEHAFLVALGRSILIELPVLWIGLRTLGKVSSERISSPQIIATGFLATVATIPYLWFIAPLFIRMSGLPLLGIEGAIVLGEGAIYRLVFSCDWRLCLGISAVANALSWGLGTLLRHMG
ncbi:MAG: hypothetical protein KKB51_16440 [Candidatus Riflebacteria bacterium]|nr:hypothetical protein [Candidatus Riflebacteria bacterium]